MRLNATSYDAHYYEEHRDSGLVDYAAFGQWQLDYGRWLVDSLSWQGTELLDIGCACGASAQGLLLAGARSVTGIDLCEAMIRLGRDRFPGLRLEVCDAIHLHLFADGQFGGLHSAQVAEHWRPEHVPWILRELRRVAQPGARLYLCLDTVESGRRQGKDLAALDPTHLCIRPLTWWQEALRNNGWRDATSESRRALESHPLWHAHFATYEWDHLVCAAADR